MTRLRFAAVSAFALAVVTAAVVAVAPVRADDVDFDLDLESLAKCLDDSGAVFYGAHWCPYCRKQMEAFGKYAKHLPYVECYDGPRKEGMNRTCRRAEVKSFPTWHYPDGRVSVGQKEPVVLATETGCIERARR